MNASDCRQTPSYVGSFVPYSPEGSATDGEGDGAATAAGAAAAQSTVAVAASAAALRRTVMAGGASPGGTGHRHTQAPGSGSVYLDGAGHRGSDGASRSRHGQGIPASATAAVTAAGQRRIRTGFPLNGHDDDPLTLPGGC